MSPPCPSQQPNSTQLSLHPNSRNQAPHVAAQVRGRWPRRVSYPQGVDHGPLTDAELDEFDRFATGASPAPWQVFAGPGIGGDDFIRLGGLNDSQPDMYVSHDGKPAPETDLDFIAAARNYAPRLIAEVRRLRGHS